MKLSSEKQITDYLIEEIGLPLDRFIITTKRHANTTTRVLGYYVTQFLTIGVVEFGTGIQTLNSEQPRFVIAIEALKERIYRSEAKAKGVTRTIEIPSTTVSKPDLELEAESPEPDLDMLKHFGERGDRFEVSLEELDNLVIPKRG